MALASPVASDSLVVLAQSRPEPKPAAGAPMPRPPEAAALSRLHPRAVHGREPQQELETANRYYRPDFTDRDTPFKDVRDFR